MAEPKDTSTKQDGDIEQNSPTVYSNERKSIVELSATRPEGIVPLSQVQTDIPELDTAIAKFEQACNCNLDLA